ncbi:dipeptidase [Pararhodonellum marinum]|uniref:dipeptidase n=1 Tax=Pararhodonellum marinum TaxID=2755358 RepID=UPI00188F8AC6|nr:membrane dipeptidase [Pararhodonellum marinum]
MQPIVDLHCDLLSYLAKVPTARATATEDIGCALPFLKQGGVKLQVLAIYTDVTSESMTLAQKQADAFQQVMADHTQEVAPVDLHFIKTLDKQNQIGLVTAIENAAGLANEEASINAAFEQLESLIEKTGKLAYISLTHHGENRFGGGNYTQVGLKDDGRRLLDYLSGRKIAIDLSHTSDLLAEGILNHLDKSNLEIPVIASHSNFRTLWQHPRNLTDEFAREVLHRKGIIGINFLRAFLDTENPERIFDHLMYGFQNGLEDQMAFGADFFYTHSFPDRSRIPFYFPNVENASKYPSILAHLRNQLNPEQLEKLAYKNAQAFFERVWN